MEVLQFLNSVGVSIDQRFTDTKMIVPDVASRKPTTQIPEASDPARCRLQIVHALNKVKCQLDATRKFY